MQVHFKTQFSVLQWIFSILDELWFLTTPSPLAVATVVEVLDTRTVSSSAGFRSFLLSMCSVVLESITNTLSSGFVKDGADIHQTTEDEKCGCVGEF